MTENQKGLSSAEKHLTDLKEGKSMMHAQWLPEVGEEIMLSQFHELVETDEILRPRIILGHFPYAAGGYPYDPRDKVAWGVRKEDNEIVYAIVPFIPEELKERINNKTRRP